MARKTEFELEAVCKSDRGHYVKIGTEKHDNSIYVAFHDPIGATIGFVPAKDLERFAVNILKALGSKKLALSQRYKSKDFFSKNKKQ